MYGETYGKMEFSKQAKPKSKMTPSDWMEEEGAYAA